MLTGYRCGLKMRLAEWTRFDVQTTTENKKGRSQQL